MGIQEIRIEEMSAEEFKDLRNFLLERGSDEIEPQEIHDMSPGFQKEPIIIALVVALGGPVIVRQVVSLVKEWLRLRYKERDTKMKIIAKHAEGRKQEVSLSELENAL